MTDLRTILQQEAASHVRRDRTVKALWGFLASLTVIFTIVQVARGKDARDMFSMVIPFICVSGVAAAYTPKHREALRNAIAEPDPNLDPHFASALTSEDATVAKIGRQAFVERFHDRLPVLDAQGWKSVSSALPKASVAEAEQILRLIRHGGTASAIDPTETFANWTKHERLRTAARETLGDLRLRTARQQIETASSSAESNVDEERQRLRLGQ